MRLEKLDKILLKAASSFDILDTFSFCCSIDFKDEFNSIENYKGYPVYYLKMLKEDTIYFLVDPTTNNKDLKNM